MGAVLDRLRQQADEAEARAESLRRAVDLAEALGDGGLHELLQWVTADEEHGCGNGHDVEKVPRGREAVRRIVRERPGIWTLAQLRAEMKQREWFTTSKALDVAVSRLCDSDREGRRIGRGRYVFPAYGEEVTIESDPSDGAMIPLRT